MKDVFFGMDYGDAGDAAQAFIKTCKEKGIDAKIGSQSENGVSVLLNPPPSDKEIEEILADTPFPT